MFSTRRRRQQYDGAKGNGPVPVITGVNRITRSIYGTDFGQKTGQAKLEVCIEDEWSERGTTNWFNFSVTHDMPLLPVGSKVRLTTACGNASDEFVVT